MHRAIHAFVFRLHKLKIGKRFVAIRNPAAVETVLRAEGKYRRRDINMTDNMNWLARNRLRRLPPLGME